MLTKKQQRSIAEIRRLIDLESSQSICDVFSTTFAPKKNQAEYFKKRMHAYLYTWVGIELSKIEGKM